MWRPFTSLISTDLQIGRENCSSERQLSSRPHGCSIAKSCLILCDSMDCDRSGLPVLHCLLEFAQTHVHWVNDAIQPSRPLSSPPSPAFNLSQHQGIFQWVSSLYQVAKVSELHLQHQSVLPMSNQGWFPLGFTGCLLPQSWSAHSASVILFLGSKVHHPSSLPIPPCPKHETFPMKITYWETYLYHEARVGSPEQKVLGQGSGPRLSPAPTAGWSGTFWCVSSQGSDLGFRLWWVRGQLPLRLQAELGQQGEPSPSSVEHVAHAPQGTREHGREKTHSGLAGGPGEDGENWKASHGKSGGRSLCRDAGVQTQIHRKVPWVGGGRVWEPWGCELKGSGC